MIFDILNERTRLGHLQENIEFKTSIHLDDSVNGMRNEFKRIVAFLLPTDPAKNKKKRGHPQISHVSIPRTAGKGKVREKGKWVNKALLKPSTSKTGVELRYYKYDEFYALTREQGDDLQDHRNSNGNYKGIWSG